MLMLISIGLHDEQDMSIKAVEAARSCDLLFAEFYTTELETTKEKLESMIGKPLVELGRKDLEECIERLLEEAKAKKVGILVGGDCLVATTHSMLLVEAKKRGIDTEVIHGSSILSAVAETGLHLQKFGTYVTIPFLEKTKGTLPVSVYEVLEENKRRGLHTLCLLDIGDRCMEVKEALTILLALEEKLKRGITTPETWMMACSRLGSQDKKIVYRSIKELMKESFSTPAVLILPGSLHFSEKEAISSLPW